MLYFSFVDQSKSFTSTFKTSAILNSCSIPGWQLLVHHLDTVAWSLPNSSANHLLVRLCSAKTTLMRL